MLGRIRVISNRAGGALHPSDAGSSLFVRGNIVLAGGMDSDSDGYPDGFAYVGTAIQPPSGSFAANPQQPGVSLGSVRDQMGSPISINSGGGNIVMRGRSGVAHGEADGFGSQRELVIDAGSGSIRLKVIGCLWWRLRFGNVDYYPDVAITSRNRPLLQFKLLVHR